MSRYYYTPIRGGGENSGNIKWWGFIETGFIIHCLWEYKS